MKEYEITEDIREFILGGNASFTILQDATPNTKEMQFKYRITIPKDTTMLTTPVWYVKAELSNRDVGLNEEGRNLQYQGYLKRDLSFNVGAKGVTDYNQKAINGLIWVLRHEKNYLVRCISIIMENVVYVEEV